LTIVTHALRFGLVLSAVLFALLLIVLYVNPEIMLTDYPADVKARWGPMTDRTKPQRWVAAAVLFFAGLGISVWSLKSFPAATTFNSLFIHFAIMFGTFNLLDWLVLDNWLVYSKPRMFILPGTEGMAGYSSYWFHFRGFLIGIPIVVVAGAICAAIAAVLL